MIKQDQALKLFKAYCQEYHRRQRTEGRWELEIAELDAGQAILAAPATVQIAVIRAALAQPVQSLSGQSAYARFVLLSRLVKRHLPYTIEDIRSLLSTMRVIIRSYIPTLALLRSLASSLAEPSILEACRTELVALQKAVFALDASADQRKLLKLLDDILNGQQPNSIPILADEWGRLAMAMIEAMPSEQRTSWLALLQHCGKANGTVPTKTWYTKMQTLREALGTEIFSELAISWFHTLRQSRDTRLDEENSTLLKGLAWCCADLEQTALADALGDTAIEGYHKISGLGPRAPKVARACIYALSQMPSLYGAAS